MIIITRRAYSSVCLKVTPVCPVFFPPDAGERFLPFCVNCFSQYLPSVPSDRVKNLELHYENNNRMMWQGLSGYKVSGLDPKNSRQVRMSVLPTAPGLQVRSVLGWLVTICSQCEEASFQQHTTLLIQLCFLRLENIWSENHRHGTKQNLRLWRHSWGPRVFVTGSPACGRTIYFLYAFDRRRIETYAMSENAIQQDFISCNKDKTNKLAYRITLSQCSLTE